MACGFRHVHSSGSTGARRGAVRPVTSGLVAPRRLVVRCAAACIRPEEDHTMTLSGPTRLLVAAGAVVALTMTAPAEAGGSRAATGKPAVGQCRDLTLAQASAAQQHQQPEWPSLRAQRPGHRGPQPAEGCHLRPAEHGGEGEHDGGPALLPGLTAARWARAIRSATVRRTPTSTSCRRRSSAKPVPAGCAAT